MGITAYSLFWVMQDLYHQPYLIDGQVARKPSLECTTGTSSGLSSRVAVTSRTGIEISKASQIGRGCVLNRHYILLSPARMPQILGLRFAVNQDQN